MWKQIGTGLVTAAIFGTSAHGEPATGPCRASIVELAEAIISQEEDIRYHHRVMFDSNDKSLEAKRLKLNMGSSEDHETLTEITDLLEESYAGQLRVTVVISDVLNTVTGIIDDKVLKNCLEQ